ncbi:MAG TPA: cytochrome C, partial [Vicinamibacteria bacterium]|nr:cytochrome C [Vicinamibacteria bacterium]
LEAYATGTRPSGIMESVAAALPDDTIRELAAYYGRLSAFGSESPGSSQAAGASIARDGIPELRVPSCSDCHGPGITPRRDVYPRLAGQDAAYLVQQLELFESGARGGSEFAHLMDPVASRLPASAMREVANYYASLED